MGKIALEFEQKIWGKPNHGETQQSLHYKRKDNATSFYALLDSFDKYYMVVHTILYQFQIPLEKNISEFLMFWLTHVG